MMKHDTFLDFIVSKKFSHVSVYIVTQDSSRSSLSTWRLKTVAWFLALQNKTIDFKNYFPTVMKKMNRHGIFARCYGFSYLDF